MVLSPQSMAQVPKNEDSNTTTTILNRPENAVRTAVAKTPKFKSRSRDKDSASAKRRCVSTACIACRRRKSKACRSSACDRASDVSVTYKMQPVLNQIGSFHSAMETPQAAPPARRYTGRNASTILIPTIGGKASTRRISTTSKLAIRPCKP